MKYKRYAGGDPLAPPVDIAEALDAIGEDVMAGYSPERAMREFLRRGGRDQTGLDELARRVAERRRDLLQRHNLDGTLQQVRELLDTAVLEERKQLARDAMMDDGERAFRQMQLDNLPPNTAAAVTELSSYDWQSRGMRFPVFHGGIAPLDSKGRGEMAAMDVPVRLAGVAVAPGDVVVGDADGVVIVPRAIAAEAVQRALAKVDREDRTREALSAGARLAEVFAKYGVL